MLFAETNQLHEWTLAYT